MSFSTPILAFEYRVELAAIEGRSVPGHETITSMGIECFNRTLGALPANCLNKPSSIGLLNNKTQVKIRAIPNLDAQELLDASSFSDDPGRVAQSHLSGAKGFFLNNEKCLVRPWYQFGFGAKRIYYNNITGGLFCNSHYGVLQFWHAMALAFMPNAETDILPSKKQFHCNDVNPPFRVRFIFKQQCKGLFSSRNCDPIPDNKNGNRRLQISALGALIHMVQDSYSQSHVVRDEFDLLEPSRIDCAPIKKYLTYQGQDKEKHGASDTFPIVVNKNCIASEIDDPVTATAKILWYLNQPDDNVEKFITYLKQSVFKPAYRDIVNAPNASAGDSFKL